jgi:hypothetical protein
VNSLPIPTCSWLSTAFPARPACDRPAVHFYVDILGKPSARCDYHCFPASFRTIPLFQYTIVLVMRA